MLFANIHWNWIGESLKLCWKRWNLRPQLDNNAYGKCTPGGDTQIIQFFFFLVVNL